MKSNRKYADRRACLLTIALLATLHANPTFAGDCGDDVGGVRIACACGDTVVSDTVLRATDPVLRMRCPGNGLVISAGRLAETLVLDLAGLALVGSGTGVGIDIDRGGNEGAAIVGGRDGRHGEVVAFNVGVRARRPAAVRRIEALDVKGNRREGLQLRTAGTMVIDVRAERNGTDGMRITGRGGRLVRVAAVENGATGIRAVVYDLMIAAEAARNGRHGIVVGGFHNDLRGSTAHDNGGHGVLLAGGRHLVDGLIAERNSGDGIALRNPGGAK